MDFYTRVGMYFFTLGALLSILAGALPLSPDIYNSAIVLIIFFGVFSAILNVSEEEESKFLLSASAFLITILSFRLVLWENEIVLAMANFFEVITFFMGSMLIIVALKAAVEYASQGPIKDPESRADALRDQMDRFLFTKKEHLWNFILFLAVAASFIVVLLDVFFGLTQFALIFFIFDILITLIFLADLVVLYRKEENLFMFLKNCWLDILATIPFFYIVQGLAFLRVAKLVRLVRIVRFIKLNKTLKFMSDRSGVKHYLRSDLSDDSDLTSSGAHGHPHRKHK